MSGELSNETKLEILWNERQEASDKKPDGFLSDNRNVLIVVLIIAQSLGMGPEVLTTIAKVLTHAP